MKLKLDGLEVKSFVTSVATNGVKGGITNNHVCGANSENNCNSLTACTETENVNTCVNPTMGHCIPTGSYTDAHNVCGVPNTVQAGCPY